MIEAYWSPTANSTIFICTSGTRPTSTTQGQIIYEIDTERGLIHNGSGWERLFHSAADGRTGCQMRRSAAQTISNNTSTAVGWDVEDFDSDGFASTGSGTVTIPTGLGGLYAINCYHQWGSALTTSGRQFILTAGSQSRSYVADGAVGSTEQSVQATIRLEAGDSFDYRVHQQSGGNLNVTAAKLELWRLMP